MARPMMTLNEYSR